MKKIYKEPVMEVVKIKYNNQLLAGSPTLGGEFGGGIPESRESGFEDDF